MVLACFKFGLQGPGCTETIWKVQTGFELSLRILIDWTSSRKSTIRVATSRLKADYGPHLLNYSAAEAAVASCQYEIAQSEATLTQLANSKYTASCHSTGMGILSNILPNRPTLRQTFHHTLSEESLLLSVNLSYSVSVVRTSTGHR
jgi:hypothetical protein